MFIVYLRSSSYSAWDFCQHRWFLEYCLGIKSPPNLKAQKGNIVHKALELLARQKLARQEKENTFRDDETGGEFSTDHFGPEEAIRWGWWCYVERKPSGQPWESADFEDCRAWMNKVLEYDGGIWSPSNRNVLCPERYFDLEIDRPWASYDWTLPDGRRVSGKFAIKGTVDLVTEVSPDPKKYSVVEYLDWKTGRRMDWATRKIKEYDDLRKDPQIRMYHWALRRLYPKARAVVMTIFFVNDGGPFTLCLDENDERETEEMLRLRFEEIRGCVEPRLNKSWKTCGLCGFSKELKNGTRETVCEWFRRETVSLGVDEVMKRHAVPGAFASYGDGGGRSGKE